MEIGKKMQDAINKQINRELYSGYLYLSMSAYFESINLPGFAHWMRAQCGEEEEHAMRFYKYVAERGGRVVMMDIEAPPKEWKSPLAVFEETLKHEQAVTKLIDNLVTLAKSEKDYASESMLKWFVDEQVEEEDSASAIVEQLKMVKESKQGLLMLDKQLAQRKGD